MKLDYTYQRTPLIKRHLQNLEVLKKVIDLLPKLPQIEKNLQRKSLLKSSLFSARIEGNKLGLSDIYYDNPERKTKEIAKIEIFNILRALRFIYNSHSPQKLNLSLIKKFHQLVLKNISDSAGYFRREPSAIFNQAGIAIYVAPTPSDIPSLMKQFIEKTNKAKDPGLIKTAVSHYAFEKIHPFLDGNGRVGRLISTLILKNSGFGFRGLVSLEEYFEKKRQTYYDLLALSKKNLTEFVEFFLEGLVTQAEKATDDMKTTNTEQPEDRLLPRRQEILAIIRDHKIVSFDFLKRRFRKIPDSTLHYDLKKLIEGNFLKKLGTTRGVYYKCFANTLIGDE